MKRLGKRSARVLVLVSIIVFAVMPAGAAFGDTGEPSRSNVIIVDADAMAQSEKALGLARSFVGLLVGLQPDRPTTVISASTLRGTVGPFVGTDPNFARALEDVERVLSNSTSGDDFEILHAFAQAHTMMGADRTGEGSSVYLVGGSVEEVDRGGLAETLIPLLSKFSERGWLVHSVALPDTSVASRAFLDAVSAEGYGSTYDLTIPDGFTHVTNSILGAQARGTASEVGGGRLKASELLAASVSIAPGTSETTLYVFKESAIGSLRLSNPGGFEATAGDRTASYVMETPHAVIWRLVDPVPGNWRVDVRGVDGMLSIWERSLNKYELVLNSHGTLPLDEPGTLVSHIREDEQVAVVPGVRVHARITTPGGATLLHEMLDNGTSGDAVPDDGFYTVTVPPLTAEGDYSVDLELSWSGYDHVITSRASFRAAAFPAIEVWMGDLENLAAGSRVQIATAFVHVRGEPYPVQPEEFVVSLQSTGEEGTLEVEPKRLFGRGPAWEYHIFYTPAALGRHTLSFQVQIEYAGLQYTHGTQSFVLSSMDPIAAEAPEPVVEAPLVTEEPQEPSPIELLAPLPPIQMIVPAVPSGPTEFPWIIGGAGAGLLVVLAVVAAYLLTRTRPYGYLYDDQDEPLVDFATVPRRPLLTLLKRSTVKGRDLGITGLERVVFRFTRAGVMLRHLGEEGPTIRVNNEPLTGQAMIGDRSWIGTGGKLYSFLVSPPPAEMGASAGDD